MPSWAIAAWIAPSAVLTESMCVSPKNPMVLIVADVEMAHTEDVRVCRSGCFTTGTGAIVAHPTMKIAEKITSNRFIGQGTPELGSHAAPRPMTVASLAQHPRL
jgi:hypothetical protein